MWVGEEMECGGVGGINPHKLREALISIKLWMKQVVFVWTEEYTLFYKKTIFLPEPVAYTRN